MAQMYKKSGGNVWHNKYKTGEEDKKPNFTGKFHVSSDVIKDMVAYAKSNTNPENPEDRNKALIQVAVWKRVDKNGKDYVYVLFESLPQIKEEEDNPFA